MAERELDDTVYQQIVSLCAKGDEHAEAEEFEKAFYFYRDALMLVPEPVEDWEATTWILSSIGELYFAERNMEKCIKAFEDAVRCPGGLGNPFIHLRLGQCYFNLNHLDRSADEFARAYMGAGREIFEKEDPKYLQFLATRLHPPMGRTEL